MTAAAATAQQRARNLQRARLAAFVFITLFSIASVDTPKPANGRVQDKPYFYRALDLPFLKVSDTTEMRNRGHGCTLAEPRERGRERCWDVEGCCSYILYYFHVRSFRAELRQAGWR